ncbi:MAG: hypothetical protein P3B98_13235 [Gemmatimonadota bacterium]|nr:hypothetical protein [Gemmatimonadota bacterium]
MTVHARCVWIALLALSASATAQVSVTSDAALNSQYQWRGITTTNRPVLQPDVIVAFPLRKVTVTSGVWASLEGGRYDNAERDISENGGEHAGLAEYDLFVEAGVPAKRAALTFGATTYSFPNTLGTTSAANTLEVYAKAAFDAPFAPSLAVWHDVRKVRGVYAEVGVSHELGRFKVGALSGWNLGQSVGDGDALGYFAKRGFTHADFSAGTSFGVGLVSVAPALHVVLGNDHNTHAATPTRHSTSKIWVGSTLTWSRVFGRRVSNGAGAGAAAAAAATQHESASK